MKLYFDMAIVDEYGEVHGRRRVEIDRKAAFIGTRPVSEMKMSAELGVALVSFNEAIEMMKVREFRKDLLIQAAAQCGHALADHLSDREGWNGIDRQEAVEAQYATKR